MMTAGLVIVGGSYAALSTASGARHAGYAEPIVMLSEEESLPYHRPPLSKGFLLGKVAATDLDLQVEDYYKEQKIDFRLKTRVVAIDRKARRVQLQDGSAIPYDYLALATGARPRMLPAPGAELEGVLYLRSLHDAIRLKAEMESAANAVVIGAGYIGLEVASALATAGKNVTLVEIADRALIRTAAPALSAFVAQRHAKAGVKLLFKTAIERIEGDRGRVKTVKCTDGTILPADIVVVGMGVVPNVELAEQTGLTCGNGIAVDSLCRTNDPTIVAAGDCAVFDSSWAGMRLRLESVQNAYDQAEVAGAAIAGKPVPYDPVPWFWSDQYEMKIQTVGIATGHDVQFVRGDPEGGKFSIYYFKNGRLVAIDSISKPGDHVLGRKLLAKNVSPTPEQIVDVAFDMKSLLVSPAA
jgi:3-phenylpropionate/trans-cinnamate dioxygenase ferredoxin reductase subunit